MATSINQFSNSIEFLSWQAVRSQVALVNPELAKLLDKLDPGSTNSLILVHYPFGSDLLHSGKLFLPDNQQQLIALDDEIIPKQLRNLLSYSKIPLGFLLDKTIEVYYETAQRTVSDKLWPKGTLFGIWELLDQDLQKDSAQLSNLSAGARSIFMLPKISDQISHNRLKKEFNITTPPPENCRQHRGLFSELVAQVNPYEWQCPVLYFTNKWFTKKIQKTKEWYQLKNFLMQLAWQQSYNCRRQFELNMVWDKILHFISQHNMYLQSKLSSHLKQLYLISEGVFPGMKFATEPVNNEIAPIELIQEVYSEVYRLKHYDPLLMCPSHITENNSVYYSLNYPNYFESHFPTKSTSRLMDEVQTIQQVTQLIQNENLGLPFTPNFEYFHPHSKRTDNVHTVSDLIQVDNSLNDYLNKKVYSELPYNSAFFKGCVRISSK